MNKRSIKFYRKNEAEVMKRLGFKPTKNSGAGLGGDIFDYKINIWV